ncbi:MAG TPA: hypothetical protein DEQ38_10370 [Elusimicrobia bacterium]|nr:MAG: hypothetical protein A2089_11870 [Elusimicrobia bacterium GWD2_63_28]HCC48500.1 hypothetical protein [Elusimicrobiota bacterium]
MKALLLALGLAGLFGPAVASPSQADLDLAAGAVREVRLQGLRSPSEIKMVMAGIAPDSPQAHLLPGLKTQYADSLRDLLALRAEFDKEFSWGHNPGFDYLAGKLRELALKHKAGNCTEQAFLAQAHLRSRGIKAHLVVFETFDWWTMKLDPDKNHVFAVFNLPEGANPAVPGQWGADAVVADPWGRLAGPAQESLRVMLDEIFRLDQSHQKPRYHVLDYEHLSRFADLP